MGPHYALSKNGQCRTITGVNALDRALAFADGTGSIWEMNEGRARSLGLRLPVTDHQLWEVGVEADVLLWCDGRFLTTTGNRPAH